MCADITCPVDHNDMVKKEVDGTRSYECSYCAGQLVLIGSVLGVDEVPSLSPTLIPSLASVDCPLCKTTMLEHHYKSIEIDLCPNCPTIWLDPGELVKVVPGNDVSAISEFEKQLFNAAQDEYFVLPYPEGYGANSTRAENGGYIMTKEQSAALAESIVKSTKIKRKLNEPEKKYVMDFILDGISEVLLSTYRNS